ncbi:hypothetical protein AQB9606_02394 [Aquabacterium sp. CECT 9606]|nr:hypothetical protein AQB9606_02394 [Aquabacterium sp. CECT 9606]
MHLPSALAPTAIPRGAPTLVKLGATREEIDETLGVTTYMGGGPSLMYAASAIAAFEELPPLA